MKPIDFRNVTFAELQARLAGGRAAVLAAWNRYGPGTTAVVAARAQISILTFRPRTTELLQLGFLGLAEQQRTHGEGTYRSRTDAEVATWLAEKRERQTEMAL